MKKIGKIILIVIICFIVVAGGGLFYLSRGLEAGKKVEVNTLDLSSIQDGTYTGKYTAGRWTNQVKVTVRDNQIKDISVVKDVLFNQPGVKEKLITAVLEKQNLNIDIISEATVTSKAYLKAIENSLIE